MVLTTEQHGSNSAHGRDRTDYWGGGGCIVQGMMDLLMNRKKCKKKCRSSFEQIIFAFQFSRKVESRNLFSNKKLHL